MAAALTSVFPGATMDIEHIIAEMRDQGLRMEPENNGESVDILTETLASLRDDFEPVSRLSDC